MSIPMLSPSALATLVLAGWLGSFAPSALAADCSVTPQLVPNPEPGRLSGFGTVVAADGATVAIAAPGSLAVWIYVDRGAGYELEQKIQPSSPELRNRFGEYLDLSDDRLVIGHPFPPNRSLPKPWSGGATVYRRVGVTWEVEQLLEADAPIDDEELGHAVAIDGDVIALGAPGRGTFGAALVFEHDGDRWGQVATLGGVDRGTGETAAVSGDELLVGVPSLPVGTVRSYRRVAGSWTHQETLTGPGEGFGAGLAIRGDRALIGSNEGTAQFFRLVGGTWALQGTFDTGEREGHPVLEEWMRVDLAPDRGLSVVASTLPERAWLFAEAAAGWRIHCWAHDERPDFDLGYRTSAVLAPGGRLIVGTGDDDRGGLNSGAAWVFDLGPDPELDCDDGLDDDSDGLTDCDDPDCCPEASCDAACVESRCDDGLDDDGNGLTDCQDADCDAFPGCLSELHCTNGFDDDRDGLRDCLDPDCVDEPGCGEDCTNEEDDDGDLFRDCWDTECTDHPECPESDCSDGVDNEGDGTADCLDPDCRSTVNCDLDGDLRPDHEDCAPALPGTWASPGDPTPLFVGKLDGSPAVGWASLVDQAGPEVRFELRAGSLAQLLESRVIEAACLTGLTGNVWVDDAPGEDRYYLVTATNDCGQSPAGWGEDSLGARRPGCP